MPRALFIVWVTLAGCGDDGGGGDGGRDSGAPRDAAGMDGAMPPGDAAGGDAAGGDGGPPDPTLACTLVDCGAGSGETIAVAAGGDLQAALDMAGPGDTVELAAGSTFRGSFVVRGGDASGCVTVRTSTPDAMLPAGVRVTPGDAARLARIETGNDVSALSVPPGESYVRLVGLEIAAAAGAGASIEVVALGSAGADQDTMGEVPHHIVIERSYVHGIPGTNIKRGIGLNSGDTCVVDSTIADFSSDFQDSQAIGGFNGPGPFEILNNRLEGAAENIMFGGAAPAIADLVPSDITIRGNHFFKPLEWMTGGYQPWVKNLFECKNARRVLLEGNLMENNWAGADQHGYAILLTPRGEGGAAPQATCDDIRIERNVILHVGGGLQIAGYDSAGPSGPTRDVVVRNNLFADIREDYAFDTVRVIQFNGVMGLVVDHNTFIHTGSDARDVIRAFDRNTTGFEYTNNVIPFGSGFWSDCGVNDAALACRLPGAVVGGNVLIGGAAGSISGTNFFPADTGAAGFVDYAGGATDWRGYALAGSSPYAGMATDGTTPGIDAAAIDAVLAP